MEKTRGYRPRYLGNALEDLDLAKKIDQEDRASSREGCSHSREREALCRAEKFVGKTARP